MKKFKNDLILITAALIICIILTFVFRLTLKGGSVVNVITPQGTESYSITQNVRKVIIADGENTLVIKDGKVYIESADCPDKICVQHKPISRKGETIVCLPHKLVIEIS